MMYVSSNAPRIARSVFEICLRRGWSSCAELALTLCKVCWHGVQSSLSSSTSLVCGLACLRGHKYPLLESATSACRLACSCSGHKLAYCAHAELSWVRLYHSHFVLQHAWLQVQAGRLQAQRYVFPACHSICCMLHASPVYCHTDNADAGPDEWSGDCHCLCRPLSYGCGLTSIPCASLRGCWLRSCCSRWRTVVCGWSASRYSPKTSKTTECCALSKVREEQNYLHTTSAWLLLTNRKIKGLGAPPGVHVCFSQLHDEQSILHQPVFYGKIGDLMGLERQALICKVIALAIQFSKCLPAEHYRLHK